VDGVWWFGVFGLGMECGGVRSVIDGELWMDGESEVRGIRKGKCNVSGQVMRWACELVNSKLQELGCLRSDNSGIRLPY
jgi:hypothetical protein